MAGTVATELIPGPAPTVLQPALFTPRPSGPQLRVTDDPGVRKSRLEYNYLVRVKTSITLPADLLQSIDRINSNRSDFIEKASRAYIARIERARRDARDIEIINRNAKRLNAEARDAMGYQKLP
jgi:hypothetical protein